VTAIATGTSRVRTAHAGAFDVSDIEFSAGCRLSWHEHPRACLAVVVDGVVRKRFARAGTELAYGGVIAMPPGERHEDEFGREGARLIVVEADDGVPTISWFRDWNATLLAFRVASELAAPDPFVPLALEGLALELTAAVARAPTRVRVQPWLEHVRDALREWPTATATELAAEVGVHPSHLARSFRAAYGESVGGCARRLRLEWAAEKLARTDEPIASVAADAGFVDQSHFTRAFKCRFGLTPARYRSAHR
jgi:AraC family transcriptional regulator